MGAWTCSIGGVSLAALGTNSNDGTYLIRYSSTPITDKRSYHIPGTDGSLVTTMGDIGIRIRVSFRIIDSTPGAWMAKFQALHVSWNDSNAPMAVTDPGGFSYLRAYLDSGSLEITRQPSATGCEAGQVWGDCSASFMIMDNIT